MKILSIEKEIFNNTKGKFFELHDITIEIVSIPMYLSTMSCRPKFIYFLFPWKRRRYIISVNSRKEFSRYSIPIDLLSDTLITGWFAHELGHVVQYERMNLKEFLAFPFKYFFSSNFRKSFEIQATDLAREIGFGNEFSEVEFFLKNDSRVSKKYRERFRNFYL